MPEPLYNFSLEEQIGQIERDLADKRARLEQQKAGGQISELPEEKTTLREIVGDMIHSGQNSSQTAQQDDSDVNDDDQKINTPPPQVEPPLYLLPEMKDQVQELVNLSFTKSLSEGIKLAKKSDNAALIDAFHDALVDELYNQLLEKGKLKKI